MHCRYAALVCVIGVLVSGCSSTPDSPLPGKALPGGVVVEAGLPYSWKPLRMGAGGFVTGLAIHPTKSDVIYSRTDVGGVYRWESKSSDWTQLLTSLSVPGWQSYDGDYSVESVAISPSNAKVVYVSVGNDPNPGDGALVGGGRVLRSDDGGTSWQSSSRNFFISGNQEYRQLGERLAVDPNNPNRVLLGTRREGLWISENGGAEWTQVPVDAVPIGGIEPFEKDQAGVTFVTFDLDRPGVVFVGVAGAGVYRSDDAGVTWASIRDLAGQARLPTSGEVVRDKLWVAINDGGAGEPGEVFAYDIESATWNGVTPDAKAPWWAVAPDPTTPGRVVAVSMQLNEGKIYRSSDDGESWSSTNLDDDPGTIGWIDRFTSWDYLVIGRLVFDPHVAGRLWWTSGIGVFRTDDTSSSPVKLELVSTGMEELVTAEIISPPGQPPISAVADFLGFRHDDADMFPAATVDGGRFAGGTDIDFAGQQPSELVWIGAEYNMFYSGYLEPRASTSSDGGVSWTDLPNLTDDFFGGEVAISATDPNNIVWLPSSFDNPVAFRDAPKGLYVTKDRGKHWTTLPDVGGTNDFHRQMWWLSRQALAADKVDGGTFYLMSSDARFFISTDGASTWQEKPGAPPCNESTDCHVFGQLRASPTQAGVLWASVATGGMYRSIDAGTTWQRLANLIEARSFGFGAPLTKGGPLSVYVDGKAAGSAEDGLWRSGDDGATWELISRTPLGIYRRMTVVNGDLNIPGRVYVGFPGNGFAFGDDPRID
jgi:photosystem II stability/assembly factor-like uncharacterized protein